MGTTRHKTSTTQREHKTALVKYDTTRIQHDVTRFQGSSAAKIVLSTLLLNYIFS